MKISNKEILKIILYSIPIILAVIFFILFKNINSELYQIKTKYNITIESYNNEKEELIVENKKLREVYRDSKNVAANGIGLNNDDIENIRGKGLSNPVKDIISDLRKHKELIPYKGVLGGTMGFYGENSIWILTNKWVFACFEDGHTSGYILLEYNILNDGKIYWKRLAAMRS